MTMVGTFRAAYSNERAARKTRPPRVPLAVRLGRLSARVLPRFAAVRRAALHLGAFAAIDYGVWELSRVAGLIAIGVSLLVFDYLAGDR
jgi:hypothetical protein